MLLQRSAVRQSPLDLNVSMNFDHFENSSIQVFSQYWGSQVSRVQEKRLLVLLCPADPTCPESVTILCWRQCPDDFFLLSTTLYERLLVTICNWRNYPMLTPPANAKNTFFLQDSEVHGELAFLFVCLTTMCPFYYSKAIKLVNQKIKNQKPTQPKSAQKCFSWLRISAKE